MEDIGWIDSITPINGVFFDSKLAFLQSHPKNTLALEIYLAAREMLWAICHTPQKDRITMPDIDIYSVTATSLSLSWSRGRRELEILITTVEGNVKSTFILWGQHVDLHGIMTRFGTGNTIESTEDSNELIKWVHEISMYDPFKSSILKGRGGQ